MIFVRQAGGIDTTPASWARDIRAQLRSLEPGQGNLLQMVYFERLHLDEVGTRLSLSRAAVTARLAAALQALALAVLATE